jgi:hypothetical protein
MSGEFEARLKAIDRSILTPLVRRLLQDETAEILDWSCRPLGGGLTVALGVAGVYRFSGAARVESRVVSWSLVLKIVRASEQMGSDPSEWHYWKREALAYRAGLLERIPGMLAAPRCFEVTEHAADEDWIWLEDIAEDDSSAWSLERYGLAARHLGQFNGAYLAGRPLPEQIWLSGGRVRSWLAWGEPALLELPKLCEQPLARSWLSTSHVERVLRLWSERERFLEAFDHLPRSLCHHDAFRRNLLMRRQADDAAQTVAVDWAIIGTGAVGEDIASLVTVSLQFLDIDAASAGELDAHVFAGYLDGLSDAGWDGDPQVVRFGYTTAAALFMGVGAVGVWLPALLDDQFHGQIERAIGHPLNQIVEQFAVLQSFVLDLGDEARELLNRMASS